MKINIKEFGEIDTNKHELCPVPEANNEIRVTSDVFFTINRLLRLVTFVIRYVMPTM